MHEATRGGNVRHLIVLVKVAQQLIADQPVPVRRSNLSTALVVIPALVLVPPCSTSAASTDSIHDLHPHSGQLRYCVRFNVACNCHQDSALLKPPATNCGKPGMPCVLTYLMMCGCMYAPHSNLANTTHHQRKPSFTSKAKLQLRQASTVASQPFQYVSPY